MDTITSIFLSGRVAYGVAVPVIREIAAVLLAISIAKDCKARDNGSSGLWALFTLISPLFAGIVYFIYSRIAVKRDVRSPEYMLMLRQSKKLFIWAAVVYIISLCVALAAIITMVASGVADFITK